MFTKVIVSSALLAATGMNTVSGAPVRRDLKRLEKRDVGSDIENVLQSVEGVVSEFEPIVASIIQELPPAIETPAEDVLGFVTSILGDFAPPASPTGGASLSSGVPPVPAPTPAISIPGSPNPVVPGGQPILVPGAQSPVVPPASPLGASFTPPASPLGASITPPASPTGAAFTLPGTPLVGGPTPVVPSPGAPTPAVPAGQNPVTPGGQPAVAVAGQNPIAPGGQPAVVAPSQPSAVPVAQTPTVNPSTSASAFNLLQTPQETPLIRPVGQVAGAISNPMFQMITLQPTPTASSAPGSYPAAPAQRRDIGSDIQNLLGSLGGSVPGVASVANQFISILPSGLATPASSLLSVATSDAGLLLGSASATATSTGASATSTPLSASASSSASTSAGSAHPSTSSASGASKMTLASGALAASLFFAAFLAL